jgi:hypothetical protein
MIFRNFFSKTNYGFLTVDGPEQNDQSELSYLVQQRQIMMIIVKTEKKIDRNF